MTRRNEEQKFYVYLFKVSLVIDGGVTNAATLVQVVVGLWVLDAELPYGHSTLCVSG